MLVTDNGKEYYNTSFQSLMKDHNIHHYSTFSPFKRHLSLKGLLEQLRKNFSDYFLPKMVIISG